MKPLEELKRVAEAAYNRERWILGGCSGRMITTPSGYCGDGFIAEVDLKTNAEHIATFDPVTALKLIAALERSTGALELISNRCLCERGMQPGFDYGEVHPKIGKPGIGKRWLTPSDIAGEELTVIEKILKGDG